MKILYFTKYSRKGASSRLRSFQYIPFLEGEGFHIEIQTLFGDQYLTDLYEGRRGFIITFNAYVKRFLSLFKTYKFDLLIIEKELFPYLPAWFEQLLSFFRIKYIVDYDDAIFHNYDMSHNMMIRLFLSNKIDTTMKSSHHVIAGNNYLGFRAQKAEAKHISIIPTVIDLARYSIKTDIEREKIVVGWIGTKSTFEKHFKPLLSVVQSFEHNLNIEFHVVGVRPENHEYKNVQFFEWTESEEVEMIKRFDIGIMPLVDSAWEKGKCAYKLIQYMGCGLPVVCSPVGMNISVVKNGWNGYHADSAIEWQEAISKLVKNKKLRIDFGKNGRLLVEREYNLQKTEQQLLKIIKV